MRQTKQTKKRQEVTPVHQEEEEEIKLSEAELSHIDGVIGPRSPLFCEVLPLFDKKAYVILRDDRQIVRQLHLDCPGSPDSLYFSKEAKKKFITEHPIIAINVSRYPCVAGDGEWEYYIKSRYPSVRDCTCNLRIYMKDSRAFKRQNLVLSSNYFYLAGLNELTKQSPIWPCHLTKVVNI
jgi:hypothetical protein